MPVIMAESFEFTKVGESIDIGIAILQNIAIGIAILIENCIGIGSTF